jgi:concentrative nucleoside transporter, CNT family
MGGSQSISIWTFLHGIFGMLVILFISFLLSSNKKAIPWRLVFLGLTAQLLIAIGVLYFPPIKFVFEFIGKLFIVILDFTKEGTKFVFGTMAESNKFGMIFAFQVLPTIIFFSALTSLLFYFGIIQKIVYLFALLLSKLLRLSGAESLAVTGTIFLGQSEAPLLIKPYLATMTKSEIFMIMSAGMATMAGSVLAVYIGFLGGNDPVQKLLFAKHLLAASVMAAPGAIVIAKMIIPQTAPIEKEVLIPRHSVGSNILDAISNGTTDGIKLTVNIAAMLIVFISFMAMFNYIIGWIGNWTHWNNWVMSISNGRYHQLSLEFILGYAFAPIMWLLGINIHDIHLVGQLLGEKLVFTEMIGYKSLTEFKVAGVFAEQKSIIVATYVLCGFANFASIGIQLGGLGALAPNQRVTISKIGFTAMIAGTLASLLSATIISMLIVV